MLCMPWLSFDRYHCSLHQARPVSLIRCAVVHGGRFDALLSKAEKKSVAYKGGAPPADDSVL